MTIDFTIWLAGQAILASAFLVPSMYELFAAFVPKFGLGSATARLPGWFALHALFGVEFFTEMFLVVGSSGSTLTFSEIGPLGFMAVKTALVWEGEKQGQTWLWYAYVALSVLWALAAIFF